MIIFSIFFAVVRLLKKYFAIPIPTNSREVDSALTIPCRRAVKMSMSVIQCKLAFSCGLCRDILSDPHQTACCGSHFCKGCVDDIEKRETTCPECNAEDFSCFRDKHFGRLVHELDRQRARSTENPHCQYLGILCIYNCSASTDGNIKQPQSHAKADIRSDVLLLEDEAPHQKTLLCHDNPTPIGDCGKGDEIWDIDECLQRNPVKRNEVCAQGASCNQMTGVVSKLSKSHKQLSVRQEKMEQLLENQVSLLQALSRKVEVLENRVSSHALLPFTAVIPCIDSYIEGDVGDEWKSQEFYTGTHSNKGYKLQLSVVPHSLHMRNKEKALSARLLITSGDNDHRLPWPFHARFSLAFVDPSGKEAPHEVNERWHTWESNRDESSMQFIACITHKELIKYVQCDNSLHLSVTEHNN